MLTRISVRNLACFDDKASVVDLSRETVIIGPNNVGKSAMIAAFNALHGYHRVGWQWTVQGVYDWGSYENIVHRHDIKRKIEVIADIDGKSWSGRIAGAYDPAGGGQVKYTPEGDVPKELEKIWYISHSRAGLPRELQVGSAGPSTPWAQPIEPDGSNVISYLLERYTGRDEHWKDAEVWLKRISPELVVLKSPLRGMQASLETSDSNLGIDINMAIQGTGLQKALSIIAAVIFSPEGSTIIIEEPETHLHPRSQEVMIDLFNLAVRDWKKQIIFTTHSWDMLLPFTSDIATGSVRGATHVKADAANFKLLVFDRAGGNVKIDKFDITGKEFKDIRDYLKKLWG